MISRNFLSKTETPQQEDSVFKWDIENQKWSIESNKIVELLSPFGNEFSEIAPAFIALIKEKFIENGKYSRTWGDYRYTDLELDPLDWNHPILHLIYVPIGSQLTVRSETGYVIKVKKLDGTELNIISSYNIIYETKDDTWYYYAVLASNIINVDTLTAEN